MPRSVSSIHDTLEVQSRAGEGLVSGPREPRLLFGLARPRCQSEILEARDRLVSEFDELDGDLLRQRGGLIHSDDAPHAASVSPIESERDFNNVPDLELVALDTATNSTLAQIDAIRELRPDLIVVDRHDGANAHSWIFPSLCAAPVAHGLPPGCSATRRRSLRET